MTRHHVVVGIDDTATAFRALDRAAEEAARRDAVLHIVYAVPDPDEAKPILSAALARVYDRHPALTALPVPLPGSPAAVLAERSRDALLTVVGTRGLGGVAGHLLGSVARDLAERTNGPLLIVRGDPRELRHAPGHGDVLLCVTSDGDAEAAAVAFAEAERLGTGVRVRTTRPGMVHAALQAALGSALVVVALHRDPRVGSHLDRVAQALLHHSPVPVLLVPVPVAARAD
ncbi:universal stress protein [Streptomyces sp. NBC_01803]|uniref:universal stress protein n=1 Tax=Streptomyces sp. NBC_01803 TaxID=2975946 RepID=UPI002DDA5304|nr:universal stress protein [Streptomyces sp. NBC_01803]WSA47342.1 universal stress protein [Streptomyces sp. NBC_01803]